MKVGIMQPYFFPYLGYFSLIKQVDRFILFDSVQFIRHGWIDRNRVLKQNEGWLYIRAPLEKHPLETRICDIRIDNDQPWQSKILSQLSIYKKIAPFYWKVRRLVEDILATPHDGIVSLNKAALESVCGYLDMPRSFEVFSQMDLAIEKPQAPDEWALNICKALGNATEYWNPPGGQEFFDKSKYEAAGIDLKFQKPLLEQYSQTRELFEPALSIIDVLMFNPPERVIEMLDEYELL